MKKTTKLLSLLLALTLILSVFTGSAFAEEEEEEVMLPEPIVIDYENEFQGKTLYFAGLEGGYGRDGWDAVIAAFEEMTGAKVEAEMAPNIAEVVRPQIQSGQGPDVLYISLGGEGGLAETMIKENLLLDVEDVKAYQVPGEEKMVIEKVIPGFFDTYNTNPYDDGHAYLVPLFYSPCGLFYNKANFGDDGYELPKTFDEFFALGDKAKDDNMALFTYPTAGYFDAYYFALVNTTGAPELFNALVDYDLDALKSDDSVEALELIGKLKDYLEPDTVAQANGELFTKNQLAVIENKALFIPNGFWLPGEMAEAPKPEGFEWGFMPLPALEEDGDRYSYTFFEQAYVSADAEEPELAKAFLAFLYSDQAAKLFIENAGGVMPIMGAAELLENEEDRAIYGVYDEGAKASMGGFKAIPSIEGLEWPRSFFDSIDSVMTGDKTVEQWHEDTVASFERIIEAIENEAE